MKLSCEYKLLIHQIGSAFFYLLNPPCSRNIFEKDTQMKLLLILEGTNYPEITFHGAEVLHIDMLHQILMSFTFLNQII